MNNKNINRNLRWVCGSAMLLAVMSLSACGDSKGIADPGQVQAAAEEAVRTTVNGDGTVESEYTSYIYSDLTLPVKEIFVKEGDRVTTDTLLCTLDTKNLEDELAVQEMALSLSKKNADNGIAAAEHQYNNVSEGLSKGTDASLVQAKAALDSAEAAKTNADKAYADYKSDLDSGTNINLTKADQAVQSAANALAQAKSMQDTYKKEEDDKGIEISDVVKEQAEDAVDSASLAYTQAVKARDDLLKQSDKTLKDLAKASEDANMAYLNAMYAYEAAKRSLKNAKTDGEDALERAKLAGDLSVEELRIAQLKDDISEGQVFSKSAGTVTDVNIKAGENSTGVLFVVEDTAALIITARIEETDILGVREGQSVTINPRAEGSRTYSGTVERVAPAAGKNSAGETDTSGEDAEFEVKIKVEDPDEDLMIGMNADVEISLE